MSMVKHQFVISSREVAQWLDSQPGTWWLIDGDYTLIGKVHFPCPNDELAEALRKFDKNMMIYTDKTVDLEEGRQIPVKSSRCSPTRRIDIKTGTFCSSGGLRQGSGSSPRTSGSRGVRRRCDGGMGCRRP
jgi:hypothetical protein